MEDIIIVNANDAQMTLSGTGTVCDFCPDLACEFYKIVSYI